MNRLSIDLFNQLTMVLEHNRSTLIQELLISKEGFESLKKWATIEDERYKGIKLRKQYSDVIYTPHVDVMPNLEKDDPEFPFNGFIFKLVLI